METALTVATKLASLPPGAVQSTKRALNRYVAVAEAPVFEFALAAESASLDTAEHKEAVQRLAKPSQKARREAGNETSEKK
jgi:enoyl-CoA hydratase